MLAVRPLRPHGSRDWDSWRRAFRGHAACDLGQPWRDTPEPLFAAGRVRLGLAEMSLAVFATLRDRDVFNPVEHFNVAAFPHGDVFEIFVRPEGQESYYEFHITPGGALLQLRWPGPMRSIEPPLDWTGAADPLLPYKISRWRIRASARLVASGWEVHAEIPLRRIFERNPPWEGARLQLNFARYDYTRGRLRPVLSATAPLTKPDFHRTAEWTPAELRFH